MHSVLFFFLPDPCALLAAGSATAHEVNTVGVQLGLSPLCVLEPLIAAIDDNIVFALQENRKTTKQQTRILERTEPGKKQSNLSPYIV